MKSKVIKLKKHTVVDYRIIYEFNGTQRERIVSVEDNSLLGLQINDFVLSKELDLIKEIVEEKIINKGGKKNDN